MKSPHFKSVLSGTLFLALLSSTSYSEPNIVFFLTDDQGYTDFGANTPASLKNDPLAQEVSTPHMDALRESGVLFTDAHSNGNVCSPTRASLVIGRYSQRSGWYGAGDSRYGLDFDEVTIGDDLKTLGYRTGMFGKWHVGVSPLHNPINRGFDKFYGFLGHGAHSFYDLSADPLTDPSAYNNIRDGIDPIADQGEYLTWRIREETIKFIDSAKADNKPYFAFVCFNAVHSPADSPPSGPWSNPGNTLRDTLMAMLSDMDNAIGEIVAHIDDMGDTENTLYFLMSDNGGAKNMGAWNGGLRGFKTSNYEGGIRVPMVMSWKGVITPGTSYDNMVMGFDIYPTAVKAAGGSPPRYPDHLWGLFHRECYYKHLGQ